MNPRKDGKQALRQIALHRRHFNVLARPHPAGCRRPGGFTTLPAYPKAKALGTLLGIHPPVLHLGHIAPEGPVYPNLLRSDRRWREPLARGAAEAVEDLRTLGGVYAEQADAVADLAAGRTPYDAAGTWLRPVSALVAAEAERLALPGLRSCPSRSPADLQRPPVRRKTSSPIPQYYLVSKCKPGLCPTRPWGRGSTAPPGPAPIPVPARRPPARPAGPPHPEVPP